MAPRSFRHRQSLFWIAAAAIAIVLPFAGTYTMSAREAADDAAAARCTALTSLALPQTAVKQANVVNAGGFAAPTGRGNAAFA